MSGNDGDPFTRLGPFCHDGEDLNVIIETPKGSRNKYKYDESLGLFTVSGFLPLGAVFPFDFGFIPATTGGDGDPLDLLLLMDEPAFAGCLVPARLVGGVAAEQSDEKGTSRNDRLIGVAAMSRIHSDVRSLADLNPRLLDEIEHFFVSYNQVRNRKFIPRGRLDPAAARQVVEEGARSFLAGSVQNR